MWGRSGTTFYGRERVLAAEEYQQLLSAASPHLQRIVLCAYETGMRGAEIKKLTWDKVDGKAGFIRLGTEDTKGKEKRLIPLSSTLHDVLEEIRREQREAKVAPIAGHVFTWKGKPMTDGWKTAFRTRDKITSRLPSQEEGVIASGAKQSLPKKRLLRRPRLLAMTGPPIYL